MLRTRLLSTTIMPSTRSATRSPAVKRRADSEATSTPKKKKVAIEATPLPLLPPVQEELMPAELSFSFEDAKAHLIGADPRFKDLFRKVKCRPYVELEAYHPFHALSSSILGQQISWKAARAIRHKFLRLFDPSIPESFEDYKNKNYFPTPHEVATTDIATLRTAGLSARKAEYIHDLATRFADGRLSTDKVMQSSDEDLMEMLVAVKGIGRWTVEMFAIFSLRRPDILPVGDLGVQRGMLRWFLALHSPTYKFALSPESINQSAADTMSDDEDNEDEELPVSNSQAFESKPIGAPEDVSVLASVPNLNAEESSMPPIFTPSIKKTLADKSFVPPPLPAGLTAAILKSRLDGKKKIKGALLTPNEMEELTAHWRPYRSLGVYYMWALATAEDVQ